MKGRFPFDDRDPKILTRKIRSGAVHYPGFLNALMKNLLVNLLCIDPDKRYTLEQIKKDPWFCSKPFRIPAENLSARACEPVEGKPDPDILTAFQILGYQNMERLDTLLTTDKYPYQISFPQQVHIIFFDVPYILSQ